MNLEKLQKTFESEVAIATQSFFTWKAINNLAVADREVYQGIYAQALVWNIVLHSLQTTYFISLGRIFDKDDRALSANSYLKKCIAHLDQFDADHLKARKLAASNLEKPEWLPEYLANMQMPSEQDLLTLKEGVKRNRARYARLYKPIRDKIMAHRELTTIENAEALFADTEVAELEEIIIFLNQLQRVIWQYLHNGRKTELSDHSINEESYVTGYVEKLLSRLKA